MGIAELRKEYMAAGLDERQVEADPYVQFEQWFRAAGAAGLHLPNAMTLATADAVGRPTARAVLMKGYDTRGFVFFTNFHSRKGRELADNARAGLLFSWIELERQVRIDGQVERIRDDESDEYFATRPLGSRLGAWASPQSEVIASRAALEARFAEAKHRYGEKVPRPPHWGGFRVRPVEIEFWQGRDDRLHDRIVYRRSGDSAWKVERLAP